MRRSESTQIQGSRYAPECIVRRPTNPMRRTSERRNLCVRIKPQTPSRNIYIQMYKHRTEINREQPRSKDCNDLCFYCCRKGGRRVRTPFVCPHRGLFRQAHSPTFGSQANLSLETVLDFIESRSSFTCETATTLARIARKLHSPPIAPHRHQPNTLA